MNLNNFENRINKKKKDAKIITIASGKGGAGKTLITYVFSKLINHQRSLNTCILLDLDFSVKGLTLLWYNDLNALKEEKYSLYDCFFNNLKFPLNWVLPHEGKSRTIPAYQYLKKRLDYKALADISLDKALLSLNDLLAELKNKADFILIDTRAGVGNYCIAASLLSDMTIIISEQDRISYRSCFDLQTNIMIFAEEEKERKYVKGELPIFVYNKVVDPKLTIKTIDKISHLPPIRFDLRFFEKYQLETQESLSWQNLKKSSFFQNLSTMWESVSIELNLKKKEDIKKTSMINRILNVYLDFFKSLSRHFFQPLLIASFLFMVSLAFLGGHIVQDLNKQTLRYQKEIIMLGSVVQQLKEEMNLTKIRPVKNNLEESTFYGNLVFMHEQSILKDQRHSNICILNKEFNWNVQKINLDEYLGKDVYLSIEGTYYENLRFKVVGFAQFSEDRIVQIPPGTLLRVVDSEDAELLIKKGMIPVSLYFPKIKK